MAVITDNSIAAHISSHYSRSGNKLVFSNGMTLNEMSLHMWERLGYKEVDGSVLSRFLRGERLLSIQQLRVLCEILHLDSSTTKKYLKLLSLEQLGRYGKSESFQYYKKNVFLEEAYDYMKVIRNSLAFDSPLLAGEELKILQEKLEKMKKYYSDDLDLDFITGELLLLEKIILLDTYPFEIIKKRLLIISNLFLKLGKKTGNTEFIGYSEAILGRIYFHYKDYYAALKHDTEAEMTILNIEEKCVVLGRLAIEYAFIKDTKSYLNQQTKLIEILYKGRADMSCFALKTLSQAQCVLRSENESRKYLDQAWNLYHEKLETPGKYQNVRKIQLNFSEIQFKKRFLEDASKDSMTHLNENTLLSKTCGYFCYQLKQNEIPTVVL